MRQRHDSTAALVFVQGLFGANPATAELFWPERVAADHLFDVYDVHVLASGRQDSAQCRASPDSVRAIAGWLSHSQYQKIIFVTTDIRHGYAIDEALSRGSAEERQRVLRDFIFQTPAADRALRSLPKNCRVASGTAASRETQTVCSTFDEKRLAGEPLAESVCDTILLARMSPEMSAAPPCSDALYTIFRDGLAATAYEAEHVLPRFGVDQH